MSFFNDIQQAYQKANSLEKLIYISVATFLILLIFTSFTVKWFALPVSFSEFLQKPWTIISYMFVHQHFLHILSNLLILFYIGSLFLDFYNEKQFIYVFFLGGIVGGITFMTSYHFFPQSNAPLGGASAGVTAVFIAIATKIPRYALNFRFIGSIELWVLATIWVVMSLLQLTSEVNGGAISHIGGAVFGFFYGKGLFKESSFIKMLENTTFFSNKNKSPKMKTAYKKKSSTPKKKVDDEYQQKIDEILDKISKSGYDSLTSKEKEFLFNAGKNN